jgi:hypothetical protein
VRRSGEVGLDGVHFAFPSLAVDGDRNLRLVASRVSRGEHPGLVHGAWGPAGGGTVDGLAPGEGPHRACRGGRPCEDATADNGWGDYNAAALDPADERTVWLYGAAGAPRPELWASWLAAVR